MGTFSLLVIGDWRQELEPFIQSQYIANPFSPHIQCVNVLTDDLRNDYRQARKKTTARPKFSFSQWLQQRYDLKTVVEGEVPTLDSEHRCGWVRVNKKGEVTEVIHRNPSATFLYIAGDQKQFLLQPGAKGWNVDEYKSEDIEAVQGYVSSARLCDIDFASMRQPQVEQAPANWDWARRVAAGRTWVPLKEICAGLAVSINDRAAALEWRMQPVIQELSGYEYLRPSPGAIDPLLLPRDDYIEHCIRHAEVLEYAEILMQGCFLGMLDEMALLSRLSSDARLTSLAIKE